MVSYPHKSVSPFTLPLVYPVPLVCLFHIPHHLSPPSPLPTSFTCPSVLTYKTLQAVYLFAGVFNALNWAKEEMVG